LFAATSKVLVRTGFTEYVRVTVTGERGSFMFSGANGGHRRRAAVGRPTSLESEDTIRHDRFLPPFPKRWSAISCCRVGLVGALMTCAGCNSILNSWLDPTTVGDFKRSTSNEIRTSLTLEDVPTGIPGAVPPTLDDLRLSVVEYPISAGDTLAIEINELRQRQIPYQAQVQVALAGYVNLPVVGRVPAVGLTVPELEYALVDSLRESNILLDPEVTVNPLFLQHATYSIFGIGVSASSNSPLRAGTFPIRRPDLRLLEAINQVGGLNEFVTEVYVFRYEQPPSATDKKNKVENEGASRGSGVGDQGPGIREISDLGDPTRDRQSPEAIEKQAANGSKNDAARKELLDALAPAPKGQAPPVEKSDIPEALELDPTQPYIYVNNEFVPNPAYARPERDVDSAGPEIPLFDTATPAVNWSKIAGETSYRVLVIPAENLRSGDPQVNIFIRAGDVIRIAAGEVGVYYVMGQVNRVGTFRFEAEQITLKAAIAAAGGLSALAWPDRCTVYRRMGQREQMIQVDLDRIFAGLDQDFTIRRGDIINVGTHPFAPFLERIRALTLPNPVSNVGYSFTYARNFADVDSYEAKRNPANEPDRFPGLFP